MNIERFSKFIKDSNNKLVLSMGEFVLTETIGQGGNGIVYGSKIFGKELALKFLITDTVGNTRSQKETRFIAEYFNIVTTEDLKDIVRYIDYDKVRFNDSYGELVIPVIIMKKYEGSLAKYRDAVTEERFLALFKFLIRAIGGIHEKGIIHRDLKPENILYEKDKFVLADFGIAGYNPDMFKVRADTGRNERIGNRLFSAPEQEQHGVEPHSTMDIYALAQILQWYVFGETHRGTGRISISSKLSNCGIYDRIIEKCLNNNPANRFQSIKEIEIYLQSNQKKDIWQYLRLFDKICRTNFPKNNSGIVHSNNKQRIDQLLKAIRENQYKFDNHLLWHNGSSHMEIILEQKGDNKWKIYDTEYNINEIWVHYNSSVYNDYILVHYTPSEPFFINGKEVWNTYVVDDIYHISYSEYENGYAEIGDQVIELAGHKVEFNNRNDKEGYFFIGTIYNCIIRPDNDKFVREYIKSLQGDNNVLISDLKKLSENIRWQKHPDVEMTL